MHLYRQATTGHSENRQKTARSQDLERIQMTINVSSFPHLSNKSRAALALMISLVRLGYSGISAPITGIENTLCRVGYKMSRRSLFRALSELETLGFMTRHKYRVGHDKFATIVDFNLPRFDFWLKKPTKSHISPQVPICREYPRTKIYTPVITSNLPNESKQPRTRARVNKIHPVLYTLSVVLTAMKARDRGIVLSRARYEIEAERAGIDAAGHSGALWYRPSWRDMPYSVRESICRREILPLLRNRETMTASGGTVEFFDAIFDTKSPEVETAAPEKFSPPPPPPSGSNLSREDLEILQAAAMRTARRAACI
jgi:hypothetical protein